MAGGKRGLCRKGLGRWNADEARAHRDESKTWRGETVESPGQPTAQSEGCQGVSGGEGSKSRDKADPSMKKRAQAQSDPSRVPTPRRRIRHPRCRTAHGLYPCRMAYRPAAAVAPRGRAALRQAAGRHRLSPAAPWYPYLRHRCLHRLLLPQRPCSSHRTGACATLPLGEQASARQTTHQGAAGRDSVSEWLRWLWQGRRRTPRRD